MDILASPKNECITNDAMAMLNIIPVFRIVDTVAEAVPKAFLSTELITTFVFGDENIPKPMPNMDIPVKMTSLLRMKLTTHTRLSPNCLNTLISSGEGGCFDPEYPPYYLDTFYKIV
jgi:hypothetical protein